MQKKKIFTIFLLFFGKYVFVGKTTSPRISAVYHRHKRAEVYATRVHALKNAHPSLHILHVEEMLAYEAYYWILACVHILMRAGYTILNNPRTIARANDLHMPAQSIVDAIGKEDINQLLVRSKVAKPSDADRTLPLTVSDSQKRSTECKINIRLSSDEKERFVSAAKAENVSYRQLLLSLLDQLQNASLIISSGNQQHTKGKLVEKLITSEEKLLAQKAVLQERIDARDHRFQLLQAGLVRYFELMQSAHGIPLELETGKYRDYPSASEYCYPEEEGPYIIRPTALLYGHGKYPARFILGIGDNQQKTKMRFYPNNQCAGVSLANPIFNKRGSVWLLGVRRASDGAMDVAYAFPLDVAFRYNAPNEYDSEMNRFFADFFREVENYPK